MLPNRKSYLEGLNESESSLSIHVKRNLFFWIGLSIFFLVFEDYTSSILMGSIGLLISSSYYGFKNGSTQVEVSLALTCLSVGFLVYVWISGNLLFSLLLLISFIGWFYANKTNHTTFPVWMKVAMVMSIMASVILSNFHQTPLSATIIAAEVAIFLWGLLYIVAFQKESFTSFGAFGSAPPSELMLGATPFLLDQQDLLIYGYNHNGELNFGNPAFFNAVGLDESDLYKKRIEQLAKENQAFSALLDIEKRIQHADKLHEEKGLKWIDFDGYQRILNIKYMPLFQNEGELKGRVCVAHDVSDNLSVKEENERLWKILENTSDFIAVAEAGGNTLFLNRAGRSIMGWGDEVEVTNKNVYDFTDPKVAKRLLEEAVPLARQEQTYIKEDIPFTKYDGQKIPTDLTFMGHKDGRLDKVKFYSIIAKDKSEKIRTQQELRISEERYRLLFENAFNGIMIYDSKERKVIQVNKLAKELFGLKDSDKNFDIAEILPKWQENGSKSINRFRREINLIKASRRRSFEFTFKDAKGKSIGTEVNAVGLPAPSSYLYVLIVKDIANEKRLKDIIQENLATLQAKNEKLKAYISSNHELENFAFTASHDLKQPIRTITLFSQLLSKRLTGNIGQQNMEYLDLILDASYRMNTLVSDLLTYSRVNSQNKKMQWLSVEDLLNNVVADLRNQIQDSNAQIKWKNVPEKVFSDTTLLKQIFQNLISNSIKFAKPYMVPMVEIQATQKEGFWEFAISDNGIGIDKESKYTIFDLFKRVHPADEYEGSGIGLSLVQKVISRLGGEIWLDSELNKGTIFYFTLPVYNQKTQQS